ncbi:adenylate kinase family protein [Candidatus Woesearchaeota archaeon]|nr:adenylate kinase family protein [Candidatus Woesearchaeota archaeon]
MKVIVITGTPGTGKTFLAKRLSRLLEFPIISGAALIKRFNLAEKFDRKRKTYVVDEKKFARAAQQEIKKAQRAHLRGIIIESHLSHEIPRQSVGLCLVTMCDVKVLHARLKKRGYGKEKIKENLEAEIFQVCLEEARAKNHRVAVINTTQGINNTVLSSIDSLVWKSAKKQKH